MGEGGEPTVEGGEGEEAVFGEVDVGGEVHWDGRVGIGEVESDLVLFLGPHCAGAVAIA